MFENPTYIVLDIPSPIHDEISELRTRFDPVLSNFPVEITLIGSSGIGTLVKGQDQTKVFNTIDNLATTITPFCTSFKKVARFPKTDIFYLSPDNPEKFTEIQKKITSTKIEFNDSPFSYTPHCTIRSVGEVSGADEKALFTLKVPTEEFTLNTLSIYEVTEKKCNLLHSTFLTGSLI